MYIELEDFSSEAMCDAIGNEWGLKLKPQEITKPLDQGGESYLIFARDMAIKFLKFNGLSDPKYGAALRLERFQREMETLRTISGQDLGVHIPNLLHAGRTIAMFATTQIKEQPFNVPHGSTINLDDWIIKKLAYFIVALDRAMSGDANPNLSQELYSIPQNLPDFASKTDLPALLESAKHEVSRHCPFALRFSHNDIKPANMLLNTSTGSIGIVDFGWAGNVDPYYHLAYMFLFRGFNVATCAKLAKEINNMDTRRPWFSMKRLAALSSTWLAQETVTQTPTVANRVEWFRHTLTQVRTLFQLC